MGYTTITRVDKTQAYADWIDSIKDRAGRARVLVRVERLFLGNPGQHCNLAGGISTLKIDVGPGYRVDYTQRGNRLLLLLAGGDKSSQADDIELAIQLARNVEEWVSISGVLPAALATLDKESLDRLDEDLVKLLVILNGDERAARIPLAQL